MPEISTDLLTLASARAITGIAFGIGIGALLLLLGLTGRRAALAAAVLLTASFVAGDWGLATLTGIQLTLAGVVARWGRTVARPRVFDILGLAGLTVLCAIGSLTGVAPAYWLAAACGAAAGAAATWTAETVGRPGLVAPIFVAGGLAIAAMWLQLLGVGEPALVAVGAISGVVLARQIRRTRPQRLAVAALVGGACSALLVAMLP